MTSYDALLLLSFGGPEGPDDVIPFLENVPAAVASPGSGSSRSESTTSCSVV